MDIIRIVAVGIIGVVLVIAIKKNAPEFALLISIAVSLLVFFMLLPTLTEAVGVIKNIAELLPGDMQYITIIIKIIGIAYITEFGAQICTDAGEKAIGSKIELAGKVLIMAASAPVLMGLIDMVFGILP